MTIRSYKMGPGVLTLNDGSPFEASGQLKSCKVEWSEATSSTDAIPVLSGEEIAGEEEATYSAKLSGSVLQDLETAGLVAWTWEHKGETVTFSFEPNSAGESKVTGSCRIIPLTVGGDVKSRPDSDFTWACPVDPQLVPA